MFGDPLGQATSTILVGAIILLGLGAFVMAVGGALILSSPYSWLIGGILLACAFYYRYRRRLLETPYKPLKLRINLVRGSPRLGALPRKTPAIRPVSHIRHAPAGNF